MIQCYKANKKKLILKEKVFSQDFGQKLSFHCSSVTLHCTNKWHSDQNWILYRVVALAFVIFVSSYNHHLTLVNHLTDAWSGALPIWYRNKKRKQWVIVDIGAINQTT